MKRVIAIVPMKGNSERLSNKNLRPFNGKPLLFWILNTLSKSKYIEQIYIATDSEEIGKVCKKYFDIKVIQHTKALAGNLVSMNKILGYDIAKIEGDYFLQTHCTNPLLTTKTIDKAINKFFSLNNFDSLFSITKIQKRIYDNKLKPINHNPNKLIRTQDLKPVYEENSNLYIFSRESFRKNKNNRIGRHPFLFEIGKNEATDIDSVDDFVLAEQLMKLRKK